MRWNFIQTPGTLRLGPKIFLSLLRHPEQLLRWICLKWYRLYITSGDGGWGCLLYVISKSHIDPSRVAVVVDNPDDYELVCLYRLSLRSSHTHGVFRTIEAAVEWISESCSRIDILED